MKNIFLIVTGIVLLITVSCRQVNQELVGQMESELTKMKETMPELDTFSQRAAVMLKSMEIAPMEMRANPNFGFVELYMKARAVNERSETVKTMCQDMSEKLDSLIQGYSDGNIKEDSVKVAFEALKGNLNGLTQVRERMEPMVTEISSDFEKAMERWNNAPESERNKPFSSPALQSGPQQTPPSRPVLPSGARPQRSN